MGRGILFVDDEENILNALSRELRPWFAARGLTWFQASSGSEALDVLAERSKQIQVVVSDLKMPGMAGDELLTTIRRTWPQIESVLVTGHPEMHGLSRAVSAGISGFVPKPWETDSLIRELEKALDEGDRHRRESDEQILRTRQLTRTRDIQQTLFRFDEIDPDHYRLFLSYQPLPEHFCGGDIYEIVRLSSHRCAVLVGDVSGRGAEAAFVTGVLHTLITQDEIFNLLSGSASTAYFLKRLNTLIFTSLAAEGARNISLTVLLFDAEDGSVQVSNAGGLPLIRLREGVGSAFHAQGFPLGLSADPEYQVLRLRTQPGDRWVLMTDGLVDRGQEGFLPGAEVIRLVAQGLILGEGHSDVVRAFRDQFPDRRFVDDVTLLSVEVV